MKITTSLQGDTQYSKVDGLTVAVKRPHILAECLKFMDSILEDYPFASQDSMLQWMAENLELRPNPQEICWMPYQKSGIYIDGNRFLVDHSELYLRGACIPTGLHAFRCYKLMGVVVAVTGIKGANLLVTSTYGIREENYMAFILNATTLGDSPLYASKTS